MTLESSFLLTLAVLENHEIFSSSIFRRSSNLYYLIVESVSFVLLRDVSLVNPSKTIEIINLRMYKYGIAALVIYLP